MRALTAISVLQTIGILVLVTHSFRDADREGERSSHALRGADTALSPVPARADDAMLLADEQRLRRVIREELARLQSRPDTAARDVRPALAANAGNDSARADSANRYAREAIAQQIETYRAIGSISDAQMLELQAAIAKLDEASRKQMMSRLVRTLNAGDLNGRF